jgi:DNA-directed RNA polymerase subunit RPC12/RpoP
MEPTTDAEAIAAVKSGGRCTTKHTLMGAESPDSWKCAHRWRTVACDGETDVIECPRCGKQMLARCDFDDEYA